ncbi:hypothetical protein [Methanococcus voltae]|uniref:Uncharacterized protein n=1 Tax=Methanococcus voltae (strain ATCC BAA-1334 / A3) TaxID=456320 RepID=D7DQQ7_METV3|nr:hypothetical protein [Methanococcus voltae]MCS3900844.1 hypothetical protein [Methanococcus voltae]
MNKVNIPPMEEVIKKNKEPEAIENKFETVEEEPAEPEFNIPNFKIPPISPKKEVIEDDDEEEKKKRGRPKTVQAKMVCAKSMLLIFQKLRKIQSKTLQDEIKELADDALIELNHLNQTIDKVL